MMTHSLQASGTGSGVGVACSNSRRTPFATDLKPRRVAGESELFADGYVQPCVRNAIRVTSKIVGHCVVSARPDTIHVEVFLSGGGDHRTEGGEGFGAHVSRRADCQSIRDAEFLSGGVACSPEVYSGRRVLLHTGDRNAR